MCLAAQSTANKYYSDGSDLNYRFRAKDKEADPQDSPLNPNLQVLPNVSLTKIGLPFWPIFFFSHMINTVLTVIFLANYLNCIHNMNILVRVTYWNYSFQEILGKIFLSVSKCYGLNCVPTKFVCWKLNPLVQQNVTL